MKLVIDTNIFISALMKDGFTREFITNFEHDILFPEYEFQEIYKHKDELIKRAGYSESEFIRLTTLLLHYMRIVSYDKIRDNYEESCNIMSSIDPKDVIFIATALAFNALIWSDDAHFKMQNKIKVLTTENIKGIL